MLGPILFVLVFSGSFVGTLRYIRFARRRGILAAQNSRTLHEHIVPLGAGIVFSGVFSFAIFVVWLLGNLPTWLMLAVGAGGGLSAFVGWIDDLRGVRQIVKLAGHAVLSVWIFAIFYEPLYAPLFRSAGGVRSLVLAAALLFIPVWLINLYNFVDGIDGMAITGSMFICTSALIVLAMTGGDSRVMLVFGLLAASSLGFFFLNLPPARVFMGDAGSTFLGYAFGALAIGTVTSGQISLWTWLTILGYYIADTTTTTLCRIVLVDKWYAGHRSHAYQNLARIYRSHAKVTYGTALYDLLWALPLAVWSVHDREWAPVAAVLSIGPATLWALRFGPLLSRD